MCSRELCDCVEAMLIPSGDRIKDLVEDIFEVCTLLFIYVRTYTNMYITYCSLGKFIVGNFCVNKVHSKNVCVFLGNR